LPTAPVWEDALVLQYDAAGNPVAAAAFSLGPFSHDRSPLCAFDAEGRVYYLRAERDHMEVVRCAMVPVAEVKLPKSHIQQNSWRPSPYHSDYGPG
jgi:hypothetical protein